MRIHNRTLGLAIAALAIAGCSTEDTVTVPAATTLESSLARDGNGNDKNNGPTGAVYSMSNSQAGNDIAVFTRDKEGTLSLAGSFPTGGTGSGSFEDVANALVLGSDQSESAPNNLTGASDFLFATKRGEQLHHGVPRQQER